MRLHLLSDLHLEFAPLALPPVDADVTICAGDVHTGLNGLKWILEQIKNRPVIYVLGNHEFYGQTMQKLVRQIRQLAAGTNVHFLESDAVTIGEVTFVGATLWTDFSLLGNPAVSSVDVQLGMTDYRRIRTEPRYRRLRAADTRAIHADSRAWIEVQCAGHDSEKVVVVTHHAPSARSVPACFATHSLSPGYASHLDAVVEASNARLWIHGHIHSAIDYQIGSTRVLSNPRGYPDEAGTGFNPELVVEI